MRRNVKSPDWIKNSPFVLVFALLLLCRALLADDPWNSQALLDPAAFAQELTKSSAKESAIFYVGFPVLYRASHIHGAVLAGPCSKSDGLELLLKELRPLPRNRSIVLYCGCCPLDKCPNIRPAYKAAASLGFTRIKVLRLPTNLHADWVAKGYPADHP
jgi:thiosulfate/3-mercaptopyruvate sulfurtransferase